MARAETLLLRIDGDLAQLRRELAGAEAGTRAAAERMRGSLGGVTAGLDTVTRAAGSLRGMLLTGIGGTAAVVGLEKVFGAFRRSAEAVGNLGELAEQLGISTDALQTYQFAAAQSGTSTEQLEAAFIRFGTVIGDAAKGNDAAIKAFRDLGVGILDAEGKLRPTERILLDVADALKGTADPAARAAAAQDLFGRSGARLLPILSGGREAIARFSAEAESLGVRLDKDTITKADQAADMLKRLELQLDRLWQSIMLRAGPAVIWLAENFSRLLAPGVEDRLAALQTRLLELNQELRRQEQGGGWFDRLFGGDAKQRMAEISAEIEKVRAEIDAVNRSAAPAAASGQTGLPESTREAAERAKAALDEMTAAQKAAAEASANFQRIQSQAWAEGTRVFESVRTPVEEYAATVERLNELLIEGTISQETFNRAVDKAEKTMKDADGSAKELKSAARDLGMTFSSAFEDAMIRGQGLRAVLAGIFEDIQRIILRRAVTEPLANWMMGGVGGAGGLLGLLRGGGAFSLADFGGIYGRGGAFAGGRVQRLAGGGVVANPTVFPMAGGAGLMGEAGPEAVMPLARLGSGELGVKAARGGGGTTVYNIDARGAERGVGREIMRALEAVSRSIEPRSVAAVRDARARNPRLFGS